MAQAAADFDAAGEWALEGAKTAGAWLMTRCHLPRALAEAQVRRGKVLPQVPLCAEALSEGSIGVAQLDALAKASRGPSLGPGPAEGDGAARARTGVAAAFCRDEALLVGHAKEMKFAPFSAVVAYWSQLADPDGAEASDLERRARRRRAIEVRDQGCSHEF